MILQVGRRMPLPRVIHGRLFYLSYRNRSALAKLPLHPILCKCTELLDNISFRVALSEMMRMPGISKVASRGASKCSLRQIITDPPKLPDEGRSKRPPSVACHSGPVHTFAPTGAKDHCCRPCMISFVRPSTAVVVISPMLMRHLSHIVLCKACASSITFCRSTFAFAIFI